MWLLLAPLCVLFVVAATGEAAPLTQTYQVSPGALVDVCGVFSGSCVGDAIEGTIVFEFDPDTGSAAITGSALILSGSIPFESFHDPAPTDLAGTANMSALLFSNSLPDVSWVFGPIGIDPGDNLFWSGTSGEGCCGLFFLTFDQVPLVLVPEPSSALLVAGGIVAFAVAGRRRLR